MDDFYQLSSEMVVTETTNNIYNNDLYDLITPQSLFSFQRVRIANMMANSGQEWYDAVRRYNSGKLAFLSAVIITRPD